MYNVCRFFIKELQVHHPTQEISRFLQHECVFAVCSVEWLVVDESDKLFEDGKTGFREQLATIFLACSSPKIRRVFFSATFAADVEQWCKLNLDSLVSVNIGPRYRNTPFVSFSLSYELKFLCLFCSKHNYFGWKLVKTALPR